jgi:protein-S-isoprenylcysteine O-methyltransferase Ste14
MSEKFPGSNFLTMIVFWIVWITWLVSEILLNRLMRSGANDKKGQDKGSIVFIWILIVLSISSGIILAVKTRAPIGDRVVIPYIGLVTIIAGMVLRLVAVRTLGRFFTVDVTIRQEHHVIRSGVYSMLRHPSYSGTLLSFIGLGLSLNNWLSLITVTMIMAVALLYRISIEERILEDQFGADYLEYKKKTYRLIPWIY